MESFRMVSILELPYCRRSQFEQSNDITAATKAAITVGSRNSRELSVLALNFSSKLLRVQSLIIDFNLYRQEVA